MSNDNFSGDIKLSDLKTYHVGALESAAHRALRQHKDNLLQQYGISGIEWYVIGTVADSGDTGLRITDLARDMGTTLGFLTKTVNMLEAKGILTRKANANDARSNYIILNDSYRSQCDRIEAHLRTELRQTIYSQITPEELTTYIKVLHTFSLLK